VALAALRAIIHQGREPGDLLAAHPPALAARARLLCNVRPALAPLVAALSWADIAAADKMAMDVRLLERHGAAFVRLMALAGKEPVDACLRLVRLARGEEGRVAGLMSALADPDLDRTPTALADHADKIARRLDGAGVTVGARPSSILAPDLLALVDQIALAERPFRRAALRALAAADIPRYLGRWRMIWTALEPAEQLAARSREAIERAPRDHFMRCRQSLLWIPPAAPS